MGPGRRRRPGYRLGPDDDRRRQCPRYCFTGEFHYFRVPRKSWADRLVQVRDLGFEGVSIYVPWNWHEPAPGAIDFTGRSSPERDLLGALDEIAAAGLTCIGIRAVRAVVVVEAAGHELGVTVGRS